MSTSTAILDGLRAAIAWIESHPEASVYGASVAPEGPRLSIVAPCVSGAWRVHAESAGYTHWSIRDGGVTVVWVDRHGEVPVMVIP